MVEIKYYQDINNKPEITQCESVSEFLLSRFKTRDELLDLRFFDTDILSVEIDQTGGEFLDINEGVIAVVHDSQIPRSDPYTWYVIIAVVTAVAVVALTPEPVIPSTGRDAGSSTNRLGDTNNEPNINGRIDDIFGRVNKHVPPLWQVPYRIGVNDQETEVLLCCVGRGRYEIDPNEWFDGDTPVVNIPNAAVNIYEPNKNPNTDTPDTVIGYNITEQIGVYRQSNDVNPAELQPPNAADSAGVVWQLSGGAGSTAVLDAVTLPNGFNLTESFAVGDTVKLGDMFYYFNPTTYTLVNVDNGSTRNFDIYQRTDLGLGRTLDYQILTVTPNQLTLAIPFDAPTEIFTAWSAMTNFLVPTVASRITSGLLIDGYIYIASEIEIFNDNGWTFNGETVNEDYQNYAPVVGDAIQIKTPEFFVPANATELIVNLSSPQGFYKISGNNEVRVIANVRLTVVELDSNGNETGLSTPYDIPYNTPVSDKRKSRFQTTRITLPYTRQKVFLERTTLRDKSDGISNVDKIELNSIYTFEPVNVTDFGDVTLAHVIIPSNSTSRLVKQRKQNVNVTRKITEYFGDGVFGATESFATSRFDQILVHMALDSKIGRMSLSEINADGFIDLFTEIGTYFGDGQMMEIGYDFDDMAMTFQDCFMLVADAVMCRPYVQSGVYDLFFEKAQTVSSMQITCRNKIIDSEVRRTAYDLEHDGVELTYRDNVTGVPETIYVPNADVVNPKTFDIKGVTDYVQALRRAKREYNKMKYQNEYVKFDVDAFGRNIVPYKRLDSPDSTRFTRLAGLDNGYRVYDGEVVEVNGLSVELSEPVDFIAGEDHYITFTKANGENSESILCTQIDEYNVSLSTLPSEPIYDGYSKDRTKYILVSEQLQQSVALIPTTNEFNLSDDGVEIHTINAVNYDSRYYQDDLDTEL